MDLSQFRERLLALGADLSAWPADDADAAVALLAVSDEAVAILARASDLDDETPDDSALTDAILGAVKRAP